MDFQIHVGRFLKNLGFKSEIFPNFQIEVKNFGTFDLTEKSEISNSKIFKMLGYGLNFLTWTPQIGKEQHNQMFEWG